MGYCERCGRYYIIRTGATVTRAVMSRSSVGVVDVLDQPCPNCLTPADTETEHGDT